MNDLFTTLSIFYLIILCGFIFGRVFKKYNQKIRKSLSYILLFILTPPIIFFSFFSSKISLNLNIVLNIIICELVLVFSTQIIVYIFFLKKRDENQNKRKGSILSLVGFPNAMLFPLPIVLSVFGGDFIIILVIFSLTQMILRSTWVTYLSIYYGGYTKQSFKKSLRKMLTFPPTLTLIFCIILKALNITFNQEYLSNSSNIFSFITTILGASLIGVLIVNINFNQIKSFKKDFGIILMMRLVFSFFLFLFIQLFIDFPLTIQTITLTILLLLFVDPPAVTNTTYAEYFELDKEFTAFSVITITLLAMFYVPFIILFGLWIF